jgi:hypothetical protein
MLIKARDCLGSSKEEQARYHAEVLGYYSQDDFNEEKAKKEDDVQY